MVLEYRDDLVDVGEVRLHVAIAGSGPPIVFLHGFPQSWYCWRNVMQALASDYTCIAPDLRGYGASDAPIGRAAYSKDRLAADVAGLLRALGHEKATVVGHDWGGGVAYQFAVDYPELLDRFAIVNMPYLHMPHALGPGQLRRSWYVFFFQLPGLPERAMLRDVTGLLARALRGAAVHRSIFTDSVIEEYARGFREPGRLSAAINYYRAFLREDRRLLRRDFGRVIMQRTSVIWGLNDPVLPASLTDGMHRFFPDVRFRFVPNCGHFVPEEAPGAVISALRELLEEPNGGCPPVTRWLALDGSPLQAPP